MPDPSQTPFSHPLDPTQLRVLGALIEKEITTPEQYPLSLNALVNACNQRSSRDPVLDLAEDEVRDALDTLAALALVTTARDARVPKYEHRIRTVLNLRRDETALLCLLLLRGRQTPGELRARADRMFNFDDLAAVQTTLDRLATRSATSDPATPQDPTRAAPLTLQLPRQPGARESRYTHLLGTRTAEAPPQTLSVPPTPLGTITPDQLEAGLAPLRLQIGTLTERIRRLEAALGDALD